MAFLDVLATTSERMHLTTLGYTHEGRALPLLVYGDVRDATPEAVLAAGKTRVFIQANIHAGEVCGKEAALILLRSLAAGKHPAWADSLLLLVAPIYNADGNERVRLDNRPLQNGPVGGMGQRPNAQGYDLNRDHMKLDAPEARSLMRFYQQYDPHVVFDLHTTNGTYHGYHLTYSPPLHPDTPEGIDAMLREHWLPALTRSIKQKYGWHFYHYGNLPPRRLKVERAWYTFDHRPRFGTNYAGLRNRFAILSEAYAYASFEQRILATLYFLEENLDYAYAHASKIRQVTAAADAMNLAGSSLALTAQRHRSEQTAGILLGAVEQHINPFSGDTLQVRVDTVYAEQMYEYISFTPKETESVPDAYFVPANLSVVLDRLRAHGVKMDTLAFEKTLPLQRFRIDSTLIENREYEGHLLRTVYGEYEEAQITLPPGTVQIPIQQPLGRLVFFLLEPRADDSLTTWGLLDDALENSTYHPIMRHEKP